VVSLAIDGPGDVTGLPFDGVDVEVVGQRRGQVDRGAEPRVSRIARAVERPEQLCGIPSDVLHDVDLARGRPADIVDVRPEHPERRPQAGAGRDPKAGFHPSERELEPVGGQETGRRVAALPVPAVE
jgi:hypothetical protein